MKRKLKNVIYILIILILTTSIGFTMYLAKSNTSSSSSQTMMGSTQNSGDMQTPPDKPDGESTTQDSSANSQNGTNDSSTTPPDKPDGDSTTQDSSSSDSGTQDNNMTPPDKPDGDSTQSNNSQPSMPTTTATTNSSISTSYVIAFLVESLLLSLVIIYLIQSKFNKKSFKETYVSKDKVIISILSIVILTVALTFGETYITNNYLLKSSSSNQNQMDNNSASSASYSSANEITESSTVSDKEYESSTADENALSVSGEVEVTADNITVTKSGDSDGGDNTSFYGTNSAIIAKSGATLTLKNITVSTNATGANGVFCYGGSATTNNSSSDGTTINISDSKITTSKDNSGGIMTTGGGTTNASNLTIETSGTSSAAIRTDRGGGTVNVDGGTYTTNGQGSPSIYSTADITVKNAKLIATASEGIVIEGKNSVTIEDTELTDTNNKLNGQSTTYKNIFLYQSMSGDADDGQSEFTATNSKITTNKGDSFYITNTSSKITLTNNTIINNDSTGNFLRAQADSWGNSGSNGGTVTLVMNDQKVSGNIVIDSVSTLDVSMNSSSYTGTINADNSAKSISITLDKDSKITLTGDSYITSLTNADTSNSNINFNGHKLYVNGKAIN